MLTPEEENEAEVRREDQDNINRFARLNARLHEVRSERDALKVCIGICGCVSLNWICDQNQLNRFLKFRVRLSLSTVVD